MSMNIYAKEGTRVKGIFDGAGNVIHGYDHDKEVARIHLKPNFIYTIDSTEVHSWSTKVFLKEFPGIAFNSVHFEEVERTFTIEDIKLVWDKAQKITIENTSYDKIDGGIEPDYSYIEKEKYEFFKKQFGIDITK